VPFTIPKPDLAGKEAPRKTVAEKGRDGRRSRQVVKVLIVASGCDRNAGVAGDVQVLAAQESRSTR